MLVLHQRRGCSLASVLTQRLGCRLAAEALNTLLLGWQMGPCHESLGYRSLGYLPCLGSCHQVQLVGWGSPSEPTACRGGCPTPAPVQHPRASHLAAPLASTSLWTRAWGSQGLCTHRACGRPPLPSPFGLTVGLDDLKGLFQPKWFSHFYDFK